MNFTVPFAWGAPQAETSGVLPEIDPNDRELVAILRAASAMTDKEKALVLVLMQTISAWGGLSGGAAQR